MGKWTVSSSGHYTYSPYLAGEDDPNKPPPGTTSTPGPAYSSPINSLIPLASYNVSSPTPGGASQQIVDWTKLGAQSPYAGFKPSAPLAGAQNMAPQAAPPPLSTPLGGSRGGVVPPLPGDPVGQPGYYPGKPPVPPGTGGQPGLPPDFDVRKGSTDPAVNHQVYGTNYFPGNDPSFQAILRRYMGWGDEARPPIDQAAFLAMDETGQGLYRQALAEWYQGQALSGIHTQARQVAGGGNGQTSSPPGAPPAGGGDARSLMNGAAYANGGRPAPGQTMGGPNARVPEIWDFQDSPQYQFRQKQAQRDLNRILMARGRSDSTGGINALARRADEIAADEIDKQYNRALNANLLNYGRDYTEDERDYGRFFSEDDRDFNRNALLTQLGQRAAELAAQQSVGYGRDSYGNVIGANQNNSAANSAYTNALLQMILGYGSDQSRNEWSALNPLLQLLGQGGQNNAALWESLGGLPTNILSLLALLGGGGGGSEQLTM